MSPTKAPMLAPLNRVQSPISTANANPVRVEIPRRQPSRRTIGGELAVGGHRGDLGIQPVPSGAGGDHGLVAGVERRPGPGRPAMSARSRRSQASWAPVQAFLPSQTRPWRSSSFDSRCRARIRSPRQSSRARTRSRAASCSTEGTVTAVRSSIRSSRASSNASRLSVLTRSPGARRIFDGAATSHRNPAAARPRDLSASSRSRCGGGSNGAGPGDPEAGSIW